MTRRLGWKRTLLVAAVAPAVVLVAGCKSDGGHGGHGDDGGYTLADPVTISERASGSSDVLKTAGTYLITTQSQWEAGGFSEVLPGPMDFGANDVVVVAMGEQPTAGYWVHIDAIQQVGSELAVQCTMNAPGGDDVVATVVTYPFQLAVVPKTGASLAVPDPTMVHGQDKP